jgi:hypothetical protein
VAVRARATSLFVLAARASPVFRSTSSYKAHFQPGMKSGVSALSTPGRHPRGMSWDTSWGQRGSAFGSPVMRLPSACDSRKVTGRVTGIATTGEQDCDLRLLLSKLFRRCRLPKERADRSLRARQRDHSDAQSVALGTWQHANADNLKGSFACRCYGCTGAGRLFAGKSNPTAFTRVARRRTTGLFN